MTLYKGFRHERSKGDDGLRTNYWYLQRVDGSEDLAVIGREIKGSGGHYNYNSAPLFGMLSWVNSSEVRKWLQTKIANPQALRSAAAVPSPSGQDPLFSGALTSHGSDTHVQLCQDLGIRTSCVTGNTDMPWVAISSTCNSSWKVGNPFSIVNLYVYTLACAFLDTFVHRRCCCPQRLSLPSTSRASLDAAAGMAGPSVPVPAMLGPFVGAHSGDMSFITDKHERNAVIGHTVGLIEAQLDALRQRTGIEYTMTFLTQERELHVLGSAAVTWRSRSSQNSNLPDAMNMATSVEAQRGSAVREDSSGARGHMQASVAVPPCVESQGLSEAAEVHPEDDTPPPAWQLQTKRALSDLWNLSELEDSRKRMAPEQSHELPSSMPLPSLPM